jgi:hypothetical protein
MWRQIFRIEQVYIGKGLLDPPTTTPANEMAAVGACADSATGALDGLRSNAKHCVSDDLPSFWYLRSERCLRLA